MEQVWFFVVVNAAEHRQAHTQCDFMGIYADYMNRLSEELFGSSWMRYTSFTRKDYNQELHGHLGIDPLQLPIYRNQFEPAEGIQKLKTIHSYLTDHQNHIVQNEWVRPEDFDELLRDFSGSIALLEAAQLGPHKWFLDMDF